MLRAADGATVAGPVNAHDGWADTLDFSPDGTTLVSGGTDGLTRLWRTTDLASLATYDLGGGREQLTMRSRFDDGGTRLLIFDGSKLWNVPVNPDDLIAQACTAVGRDLTADEWSTLVPDRPYQPTCS